MFPTTLSRLKCPSCHGKLACAPGHEDVLSGMVSCTGCRKNYPILAGVLILVPDVRGYLIEHVKGISRQVTDGEIPKEHRAAFLKAKRNIAVEHIEEDLESERVTALYLMTSYLSASEVRSPCASIEALIKQHWDQGPFARIRAIVEKLSGRRSLLEFGCGLGGLYHALRQNLDTYLGLDSSFASVALARHLALGAPLHGKLRVPDDLLQGPVSRPVELSAKSPGPGAADFVVCDLEHPPIAEEHSWDMAAALNVIDMLPDPATLPALQHSVLKSGGLAIQSSPYIWHEVVAEGLRSKLPAAVIDSASAIEWLYRQSGLEPTTVLRDVPWVFFKNIRQVELYSVHLFFATKSA